MSTNFCSDACNDYDCDDSIYWQQPIDEHNENVKLKDIQECSRHPRVIIHIDIDCFYAQVEMIHNPTLVDKPLGIQQKYLLVTCNYVARQRGVKKMMGVKEAKQVCPDLVLANGENLDKYREMSYKITDLLTQYTPLVERLGFDENFLDVTSMVDVPPWKDIDSTESPAGHLYSDERCDESCKCGCVRRLMIGSHIAAEIRQALKRQLGITCCAGVAHNKLLAKLVAGCHKPNQQTMLLPEQADQLLGTFDSIRKIPGIGWSTCKRLAELGITTLQHARDTSEETLASHLGDSVARSVKSLVEGIDDSPVAPTGLPQSMSVEDSFRKVSCLLDVKQKLASLLDQLLNRLMEDGRQPGTMRLTVRKVQPGDKRSPYHKREARQAPVPSGLLNKLSFENFSSVKEKMLQQFLSLFHKLVDTDKPFHLSLINIAFAKFAKKSPEKGSITSFFKSKASSTPSANSDEGDSVHCSSQPSQNSSRKRMSDLYDGGSSQAKKKPKSSIAAFIMKTSSGSQSQNVASHIVSADKNSPPVSRSEMGCLLSCTDKLQTDRVLNKELGHAYSKYNIQDIDPQALSELPPDIRSEVEQDLQRHRSTFGIQKHSLHQYSVDKNTLREKKECDVKCVKLNKETDILTGSVAKEELLPGLVSKEDPPGSVDRNELDESSNCEAVSMSKISNRDNNIIVDLTGVDNDIRARTKQSEIPPNVDPAVFEQLPFDIQAELVRDWKRQKQLGRPHAPATSIKSKKGMQTIKNFFNKM